MPCPFGRSSVEKTAKLSIILCFLPSIVVILLLHPRLVIILHISHGGPFRLDWTFNSITKWHSFDWVVISLLLQFHLSIVGWSIFHVPISYCTSIFHRQHKTKSPHHALFPIEEIFSHLIPNRNIQIATTLHIQLLSSTAAAAAALTTGWDRINSALNGGGAGGGGGGVHGGR